MWLLPGPDVATITVAKIHKTVTSGAAVVPPGQAPSRPRGCDAVHNSPAARASGPTAVACRWPDGPSRAGEKSSPTGFPDGLVLVRFRQQEVQHPAGLTPV